MKKIKKKFKKKSTHAINAAPPWHVRNKSLLLHGIVVASSAVILGILICIILFAILIEFAKLKELRHQSGSQIDFSYFIRRPDQLSSSKALIVYDADNQVTILSKNENVRFAPASTAKIMAAIVAREYYNPERILKADLSTVSIEGSKMGLFLGEEVRVADLIYGMMLPSGNDAAHLLAVSYPGGVEGFVARMNEKAKELSLSNTYFMDPAGYDDDNYSTAHDLARLGAYALTDPLISSVVKTPEVTVYNKTHTIPHVLTNLNELLLIPGVNGIKTGFTNEAEGVLVTSFFHNKKQYVIVVLRSQDRFQDTKELLLGIIEDLKSEQVSF